MLRFARFSQLDGTLFRIVLYIVTQFYRKSYYMYTFYSLTPETVHTLFRKVLLIMNDNCRLLIMNPKKAPEQRFYESFGSQGFRLEFKVLKRKREHLHIHRCFFLPLVFENPNERLTEYLIATF